MEPKVLAALVASLVSQALLFLPLFSPNSSSSSPPLLLLVLLLHHLSSSQIAATTTTSTDLLPPTPTIRKRKREQSSSSSSSSSSEEGEEVVGGVIIIPTTNPDPYKHTFLMSSSTFEWLSGLLDPLLDCRDPAGSPLRLPGPTRLAVALSRISSGASYPEISLRFSVPVPAARFCARHLCRVLTTNFRFFLSFPSNPTPLHPHFPSSRAALALARFPTSSAQVLADASSRILSITAGFGPDWTDADVLRRSSLYQNRQLGAEEFFIGDGRRYPLLPWLMVPYGDAVPGSPEEDFNAAHLELCRPVRRAVSSLRSWGVMGRLVEEDGRMAAACIGTCAILHNVLLMREDYSALAAEDGDDDCNDGGGGGEEAGEREGLEEWGVDGKATVLRSMLAVKARELRLAGLLGRSRCQ